MPDGNEGRYIIIAEENNNNTLRWELGNPRGRFQPKTSAPGNFTSGAAWFIMSMPGRPVWVKIEGK